MSAPVPPGAPQTPVVPPPSSVRRRRSWPLVIALIVVVALVIGGAVLYRNLTAPTLTGTWYGKGGIGIGSAQGAVPFGLYLDLKQTDSTHVSGTGEICVPLLGTEATKFTVIGTTSADLHHVVLTAGGATTANEIDANLTNGTLKVTFPSANNTLTGSASLAQGTRAQFDALCSSLATATPSAG